MTKTIMIEDQELVMTANAATSYRYKMIFKRDLMKAFIDQKDNVSLDLIQELAYVMHKQATGEANTASLENYLAWLEGFGPMAFAAPAGDIANLYADQKVGTSKAKKKAD